MTSVAIHQPNYLPWTPYWQKMVDADLFVYLDHVQIDHRGYTRKVEIHGQKLSVPIKKEHKFSPITEVEIDYGQPWRRQHTNAIHHIYAHYPRYDELSKKITSCYFPTQKLVELNLLLIGRIRSILGIGTKTIRSSEMTTTKKGAELIREIIDTVGADTYITGSSWKKYTPPETLEGIKIVESEYKDTRPILDLVFEGKKLGRTEMGTVL